MLSPRKLKFKLPLQYLAYEETREFVPVQTTRLRCIMGVKRHRRNPLLQSCDRRHILTNSRSISNDELMEEIFKLRTNQSAFLSVASLVI